MRVASVVLVVTLALAGCMGGVDSTSSSSSTSSRAPAVMEPWTPLPCASGNVTQTSRNAQMVSGLRGTEDQIAAQIATAMGDKVTGPGVPFEDTPSLHWPTEQGYVIVNMGDGLRPTPMDKESGPLYAGGAYHRNSGTPDPAQVTAFAKGIGADAATLKTVTGPQGSVRQEWAGIQLYWQPYGVGGANWRNDGGGYTVNIGPFYDFLVDQPGLNGTAAMASARPFMRCHMDAAGQTEAKGYRINATYVQGIAVLNGTVTYVVNLHHTTSGFSPCPVAAGQTKWDARWVFVDVVTGAIRHTMLAPCL